MIQSQSFQSENNQLKKHLKISACGVTLTSALLNVLKITTEHYPIWLRNNHNDVIGILPKWALQVVNGEMKTLHRTIDTTHDTRAVNYHRASEGLATNQSMCGLIDDYIEHYNQIKHDNQNSLPKKASCNTQDIALSNVSFNNGLMGYLNYDFSAQLTAENIPHQPTNDIPEVFLGHYDIFFTLEDSQWFIYYDETIDITLIETIITDLYLYINDNNKIVDKTCEFKISNFINEDENNYLPAFNAIQNYLTAGDCYQVNLAQKFSAEYTGEPHHILQELDDATNAPYAGYIRTKDYQLISCSPELFIQFKHKPITDETSPATIVMETRPIKGTLPRLSCPQADAQQKIDLQESQKNQAENLMIVDLLRNDLSVFAKTGTVEVPKLFAIESYPQVHHMVSTITAEMADEYSSFTVLLNSLPGGSITGAPKIRAIEIIKELEKKNRDAYCGSMGFINFDGTGSFNILIRTVQFYKDTLNVWAGGGITIASDAHDEHQECLDKISGIVSVLENHRDNNSV